MILSALLAGIDGLLRGTRNDGAGKVHCGWQFRITSRSSQWRCM